MRISLVKEGMPHAVHNQLTGVFPPERRSLGVLKCLMLSFWHKYGEYRLDFSILLILESRHWTRETRHAPQALAFRFPSANG